MIRKLLLLVFLSPLLELLLLVWMNDGTLWRWAFGIALASAALGVWMLSRGGVRTARQMQADLQAGRAPAVSLMDGLCRFFAAVLLIVPSVTCDLLALALLLPLTRRLLQAWFLLKAAGKMHVSYSASFGTGASFGGRRGTNDSLDESDIIDVEAVPTREPPKHLPG